ncbi:hypothetical protein HY025_05495 [Candidatus Daviesbacteria bacterium]|nr:hypothetical protein [Candidatus Daviesbacteria bacterium]
MKLIRLAIFLIVFSVLGLFMVSHLPLTKTVLAASVTVSGKAYDSATNKAVAVGLKVATCGSSSRDPVIKSDGTFSFSLNTGDLFCIRGPAVSGYTNDCCYEWQIAGINCPQDTKNPSCQAGGAQGAVSQDRGSDSGYNIIYTSVPSNGGNVSGKLFDKDTNQALGVGLKVATCGANPSRDPTVNSDGTFEFTVPKGGLYCVRAPDVSGYKNTTGCCFEWQVAGIDCQANKTNPNCQGKNPDGTGSTTMDRSTDTGYDFAYSKIVSSPTPTTPPTSTPSATVAPTIVTKIELAEDPNFTNSVTVVPSPYNSDSAGNAISTYNFLPDSSTGLVSSGIKNVWVRYSSSDGQTEIAGPASIEFVASDPVVTELSCLKDSSNNVTFNFIGSDFGQTPGTITAVVSDTQTPLALQGVWTETSVSGSLPNTPTDVTTFPVSLTRFDGKTVSSVCDLTAAQISIGADYFCPAIPNHQEDNVNMTIYDAVSGNKLDDETVSINPLGIVSGYTFTFIENGKYTLSLKPTFGLRRFGSFTAKTNPGNTNIVNLSLPVGDIAPDNGDGIINDFDGQELKIHQFGDVPTDATRSGDFNKDSAVNSFDWSCMKSDYFETDAPLPNFPVSGFGATPTPTPTPFFSSFPTNTPTPTPTLEPSSEVSPTPAST